MDTSPTSLNIAIDTNLKAKIQQVSKSIPSKMQWRLFTAALVIMDALMIGLAFRLAFFVRFQLSFSFFYENPNPSLTYYSQIVAIITPVWLVLFGILGLYDRQKLLGGTKEYATVFNAATAGMVLVIAAGFLATDFVIARGWLLLAWGFSIFLVDMGRFIVRRMVYWLRQKGFFLSMAVIVGANNEGISLAQQLQSWKSSGFHILGFVDEKLPPGTLVYKNLFTLGNVEQLDRIISQNNVEEVILATSAISSRDRMLDIFKRYGTCENINLRMSSGLYEIITTGLSVKEFAYVPLVGVNKVRLAGVDETLKFLMDYLITIPGIILISPVLLILAVLVKLDSKGPVIHRRRVMGVNGKQFDAYKFRSMHVDGDEILEQYPELKEELARNHKLKYDPRITRIGGILRKTSLDELPQLFNVLMREMSLVGPRIITPAEVEKYDKWDINLLTVRPGITGLWQISGRSDVTYEERVRLDMHYIRNWSIWFDLTILLQTLPAVILRKGAY